MTICLTTLPWLHNHVSNNSCKVALCVDTFSVTLALSVAFYFYRLRISLTRESKCIYFYCIQFHFLCFLSNVFCFLLWFSFLFSFSKFYFFFLFYQMKLVVVVWWNASYKNLFFFFFFIVIMIEDLFRIFREQ